MTYRIPNIRLAVSAGALFVLLLRCGSDGNGDNDGPSGTDVEINSGTGEVCGNGEDDDGDRAMDCADTECSSHDSCTSQQTSEVCDDGVDNDWDGKVDCADTECGDQVYCQEDCDNGEDDDGDNLVDCEDDTCLGMDDVCGEVCGDGIDNDGDGDFDCDDSDCAGVNPPCDLVTGDGMICDYRGEPHVCACADAEDNDQDGDVDNNDLHCFGPYDDDEETFATGIPGDNEGSKAYKECPFDGNSGTGNDDLCCNPTDPTQNVLPNGCDYLACCELDLNGNTTGEHVGVYGECVFAPDCGSAGAHGCACESDGDCDDGQYCVADGNAGPGFCSTCAPCIPDEVCVNPCECGEVCFGGFERPEAECGGGDGDTDVDTDPITGGCPDGLTACPGGDGDCLAGLERCVNGCCYPRCEEGVTPCDTTADCDTGYMCVTGCCIQSVIVV